MGRGGRDRFDVAGSQPTALDLDGALHERGMGDEFATDVQDEVPPADGVVPIVVREGALGIRPERVGHDPTDRHDLRLGQLVRAEDPQAWLEPGVGHVEAPADLSPR